MKSGFLKVKSGLLGRWSSRYVQINVVKLSLDFYADEKNIAEEKKLHSVPIPDGTALVVTSNELRLSLMDPECSKFHFFEVNSLAEQKAWMAMLQEAGVLITPALKEGFLFKTGSNCKTWNKRWFVLTSLRIYYFKAQDDDWKGVISLSAKSRVVAESEDSLRKLGTTVRPYSFSILDNADQGTRQYFISASQSADQLVWCTAINEVVRKLKKPTRSLREGELDSGYLHLLERNAHNKFWTVLSNTKIQFFKRQEDDACSCEVLITGDMVVKTLTRTDDGKECFLLAESRDEGVTQYVVICADSREKKKWLEALTAKARAQAPVWINDLSLCEGYLREVVAGQKTHPYRYFMLQDGVVILYSTKQKALQSDEKDKRVVLLHGHSEVAEFKGEEDEHRFSLSEVPSENSKKHVFVCESAVERNLWLGLLKQCISHQWMYKMMHSVKEGYLSLKGHVAYERRYAVLTMDALLLYKSRLDELPVVSLTLSRQSVAANRELKEGVQEKGKFSLKLTQDEGAAIHWLLPDSFDKQPLRALRVRDEWLMQLERVILSKDVKRMRADSLCEGYLWRLDSLQRWQKRYAVLVSDTLLLFARHGDLTPSSITRVSPASELADVCQRDGRSVGAFFQARADPASETFLLAADDEATLLGWADAFRALPREKFVKERSLREGFCQAQLTDKDKQDHKWQSCFLSLQPGLLLVFKSPSDTQPLREITVSGLLMPTAQGDTRVAVVASKDDGELLTLFEFANADEVASWLQALTNESAKSPVGKLLPEARMEGHLLRREGPGFVSRFFALLPDRICVFRKRAKDAVLCELLLSPFLVFEPVDGDTHLVGNSQQEVWALAVSRDEKEPLHCVTASKGELKRWRAELLKLQAVLEPPGRLVSRSLAECYGLKPRRSKLSQERKKPPHKYLVLERSRLRWYANRLDREFKSLEFSAGFAVSPLSSPAHALLLSVDCKEPLTIVLSSQQQSREWLAHLLQIQATLSRPRLFGGSLESGLQNNTREDSVPNVLRRCVEALTERPPARAYGCLALADRDKVLDLRDAFEDHTAVPWAEPEATLGVLVLYLQSLSEPPVPFSFFWAFVEQFDPQGPSLTPLSLLNSLKGLLSYLPQVNQTCLAYLLHFLAALAHADPPRASLDELADEWAPLLLKANELDVHERLRAKFKDTPNEEIVRLHLESVRAQSRSCIALLLRGVGDVFKPVLLEDEDEPLHAPPGWVNPHPVLRNLLDAQAHTRKRKAPVINSLRQLSFADPNLGPEVKEPSASPPSPPVGYLTPLLASPLSTPAFSPASSPRSPLEIRERVDDVNTSSAATMTPITPRASSARAKSVSLAVIASLPSLPSSPEASDADE